MKITLTYVNANFRYNAEVESQEEYDAALVNFSNTYFYMLNNNIITEPTNNVSLAQFNINNNEDTTDMRTMPERQNFMPPEPASEGQLNYMRKLKINIPENCTKIQAIDLINQWKDAHGVAR